MGLFDAMKPKETIAEQITDPRDVIMPDKPIKRTKRKIVPGDMIVVQPIPEELLK